MCKDGKGNEDNFWSKENMIVKTGREEGEINETVKAERIQKQKIVLELQGGYPQKMMEKFSSTFLVNFWV